MESLVHHDKVYMNATGNEGHVRERVDCFNDTGHVTSNYHFSWKVHSGLLDPKNKIKAILLTPPHNLLVFAWMTSSCFWRPFPQSKSFPNNSFCVLFTFKARKSISAYECFSDNTASSCVRSPVLNTKSLPWRSVDSDGILSIFIIHIKASSFLS